jgi:cell wall-associated NlpC family hydrolase
MSTPLRFLMVLLSAISITHAEVNQKTEPPKKEAVKAETPPPAAVSTVSIDDLSGFESYPKQVQSLVQSALALTRLGLSYLHGSNEPNKGGMDCSGTVYHVLQFQGLKGVPRQSDEMCQWVEKKTQLHLTPTAIVFDHAEFMNLKPGDLLFWTNTMETKRKLPVTHVMIYLGKLKKSGKRVVFGASDGRSFEGLRRSGVSVFDFHLPKAESTSKFHGYGNAPGLLPATSPVIVVVSKPGEEVRKATVAETKPKTSSSPVKQPASKPVSVKKRTPPPPPKSAVEKTLDRAVDSVRRFFK